MSNTDADTQASKHEKSWSLVPYTNPAKYIRGFFDGSLRGKKAVYGWVVFASDQRVENEHQEWREIASKSGVLPEGSSITAAELEGMTSLLSFLRAYYEGYEAARELIDISETMDFTAIRTLSLADMV